MKILLLSFMLYFIPLLGIIGLSYFHGDEAAGTAPTGTWLFTRWVIDCLTGDGAGVPLIYSAMLHIQLFLLIGAMLMISEDLSKNMDRLSQIRQAAKLDQHNALELN